MLIAISGRVLGPVPAPATTGVDSAAALVHAVADAGWTGLELPFADGAALDEATPQAELATLREHALARGVVITTLSSASFFGAHYASESAAARQAAATLTVRMLDAAVACGAPAVVVIPAVVGAAADARMQVRYADAMRRVFDALRELRHEAEARGVRILLENAWNRFLLSPLEAADLLDRVNSPWTGFCLDVGNVLPMGYPQDWILTLGGRLGCLHVKDYDLSRSGKQAFCAPGEGSVDWPAVREALRRIRFDGPLVYEGPGGRTRAQVAALFEASGAGESCGAG
jgi:L-ribulose-5-phosphate 3-epimerase